METPVYAESMRSISLKIWPLGAGVCVKRFYVLTLNYKFCGLPTPNLGWKIENCTTSNFLSCAGAAHATMRNSPWETTDSRIQRSSPMGCRSSFLKCRIRID
jgi:hypothetical protein